VDGVEDGVMEGEGIEDGLGLAEKPLEEDGVTDTEGKEEEGEGEGWDFDEGLSNKSSLKSKMARPTTKRARRTTIVMQSPRNMVPDFLVFLSAEGGGMLM
jgi:hypothetical protein